MWAFLIFSCFLPFEHYCRSYDQHLLKNCGFKSDTVSEQKANDSDDLFPGAIGKKQKEKAMHKSNALLAVLIPLHQP